MTPTPNVSAIPLALYIHIPWCVKKCPYCDFNSHTLPNLNDKSASSDFSILSIDKNAVQIDSINSHTKNTTHDTQAQNNIYYFDDYVSALIADIDSQLNTVQNREITSIFIGGGTPSLLPIAQYKRLFAHLKKVLTFSDDIEVTMEANPGTLEHAPFAEYLDVGINRLSIGVQSFDNDKLLALGRIHDANQAKTSIKNARQAGFNRVNIDLMHGLPNQSVEDALTDLRLAHQLGATHISWYQLTIEPNTVFYRDTPVLPDEDNLANIEKAGSEYLKSHGYDNYEISAWVGKHDKPCQHNVNYWQFGDYLAIGAGGHGKLTIDTTINNTLKNDSSLTDSNTTVNTNLLLSTYNSGIYRYSKTRLPKDYLSYQTSPKTVGWQAIAAEEISSEFMLNALRLTDGISVRLYKQRTGQPLASIEPTLSMLRQQGLLVEDRQVIKPTTLGRRYLNRLLQAFL